MVFGIAWGKHIAPVFMFRKGVAMEPWSNFLISKCRLVPLKAFKVSRFEHLACVLLSTILGVSTRTTRKGF